MEDGWRARLQVEAEARLDRLVAEDDRFRVDAEQPAYRGGTHFVTFGSFEGRPAVFKSFVADRRWRNESACLWILRDTRLVPTVFYEESGTLIVMERLGGADVMSTVLANGGASSALGRAVGAALGALATSPLPSSTGYDPRSDSPDWGWDRGLREVVARCGTVGREVAAGFGPERRRALEASLRRIEARLPEIERERWILFHEDVSNMRVDGDAFVGLYDLELCRGGTASMQLGAALNLCLPEGSLPWDELRNGFEPYVGMVEPESVVAMHHLSCWLRICGAPKEERCEAAGEYVGRMEVAERTALGA